MGGQRGGVDQLAISGKARRILDERLSRNAGLVGLENLTRRAVELDAVAVIGDMAAGDHERGHPAREGVVGEGRCRDMAAIHRHAAGIADRLGAGAQDARCARAQIAGQGDLGAGVELSDLGQILQKPGRKAVTDPVRHGGHQPPCAAGSEGDAAFGHQVVKGEGARRYHG